MPQLNVGDHAPQFEAPDADGAITKLSDFEGSWVVLYFYPKDNTPGCTIEALDFTALSEKFSQKGAQVIGVSKDSCASHKKFIDKKKLKLTLLADESLKLQKKYGVWRPKKFMGREFLGTIRSTFLIDPKGKIAYIWDKVSVKDHAKEVLSKIPTS